MRDTEFLERRSTENLVELCRQELLRMIEGESCVSLLTVGVRRRLKKEGILLKEGNRYTVSPLGRSKLGLKEDMRCSMCGRDDDSKRYRGRGGSQFCHDCAHGLGLLHIHPEDPYIDGGTHYLDGFFSKEEIEAHLEKYRGK
ncbi:MAG: hypothetical protein NWE88_03600 [Candidatus Bathyarchaeota archaeon]|nr:hypothetical protein [Candidatus Bathyarchaeota archaeon]